jgi:hypothetical protein
LDLSVLPRRFSQFKRLNLGQEKFGAAAKKALLDLADQQC